MKVGQGIVFETLHVIGLCRGTLLLYLNVVDAKT